MEEPSRLPFGEKLRQFPDPAGPDARAAGELPMRLDPLKLLPPRSLLKLRQPPAGPLLREAPAMRELPTLPPKRLATA